MKQYLMIAAAIAVGTVVGVAVKGLIDRNKNITAGS